MGSTERKVRRKSGVDDEMKVGMVAWRRVAGRRLAGTEKLGRREREGYMVRGGADVGVTMRRVRMRSKGASRDAAMAVAATATLKDISGDGLSMMSRPPIPLALVPMRPGSGTLRSAESMLRVQLSVVFNKKLYMKVTFVPFHTPHADSFCHSCAITSRRESAFLSSSFRGGACGARVGVISRDRLFAGRLLFCGLLDREAPRPKPGLCIEGAVLVK